jgi:hypothetical protein
MFVSCYGHLSPGTLLVETSLPLTTGVFTLELFFHPVPPDLVDDCSDDKDDDDKKQYCEIHGFTFAKRSILTIVSVKFV